LTAAAVAVSNDLGDDGGSQWRMMAGNDVGDDVGNDVGNGDDDGNYAGNDASEGDGGDTGGEEGGGAPGGGRVGGSGGSGWWRRLHIAGVVDFYCEDIFVWYFYDMWEELARSHLPSHSRHA
jgi:hypothetical protein